MILHFTQVLTRHSRAKCHFLVTCKDHYRHICHPYKVWFRMIPMSCTLVLSLFAKRYQIHVNNSIRWYFYFKWSQVIWTFLKYDVMENRIFENQEPQRYNVIIMMLYYRLHNTTLERQKMYSQEVQRYVLVYRFPTDKPSKLYNLNHL